MDRLIYVAMTGAKHLMHREAVTANNLANATTTGFRADLEAFRALPAVGGKGLPTRAFVVESSVGQNLQPGILQRTGRTLDVAVQGQGWLVVQTSQGEAMTRAGSLVVDSEGNLKTSQGLPVVGDGGPITVPADPNLELSIGADGTISSVNAVGSRATVNNLGRLKLVNPPAEQITKGTDGLFRRRDGAAFEADESVRVASGMLEGSNVNVVNEMVHMISAARQYETQIKLLQKADENARQAAQIMSLAG